MTQRNALMMSIAVSLVSVPPAAVAAGCLDAVGYLPIEHPEGYAVAEPNALVARGNDGLSVVDLADPAAPEVIGHLDIPAWVVAISGDYAYVLGQGNKTLTIVDISDPTSPTATGSFNYPANQSWKLTDLQVSDNLVFVLAQNCYIFCLFKVDIFDVSRSKDPVMVGSVLSEDLSLDVFTDLYVAGRLAYVLGEDGWVRVLDVSDPQDPGYLFTTHFNGCSTAGSLAGSGTHAFLACRSGLTVLDLVTSYPYPEDVGFVTTTDYSRAVTSSNDFVNVAFWGAVSTIDVSDPSTPIEVCSTTGIDEPLVFIHASENYVYVGSWEGGLTVLRGAGVFADGFESGCADSWSSIVGGTPGSCQDPR